MTRGYIPLKMGVAPFSANRYSASLAIFFFEIKKAQKRLARGSGKKCGLYYDVKGDLGRYFITIDIVVSIYGFLHFGFRILLYVFISFFPYGHSGSGSFPYPYSG